MTRVLPRLTLLAAVLALALPAATASALPVPGVNLSGYGAGELDDAAAAGARVARVFVPWPAVEPARGSWSTGVLDGYAADAVRMQRRGMRPIFVLLQTPAWASGSSDPLEPPDDPGDFATFARRFAQRMHDALAPVGGQVAGYEVWNEPDEGQFWRGGPQPARYAALLERAYPAIKAADPRAKVVLGPTTGNNYGWLEQLYGQGAGQSFDAVAVHTDTACLDRGPDAFYRDGGRIARFTFLGYREVHATMAAHGDGAKPIWMTELGWSANSLTCSRGRWAGQKPAGVSEADQAAYLRQAFHCMASDPYVEYALWFNHRD
ncbi:MAG TPA: hypothetical protein VLA98_03290, partial [Solirubrobacteraceae bacterium]|nr:hypothetical protein [Solirubrobacteraceae bacterium]